MDVRPLARWTIGKVHGCGMEVLRESLKTFPKVYPEFDMVVCYNNIDVKELSGLNVELYEQKQEEVDYPLTPPDKNFDEKVFEAAGGGGGSKASGWKLTPPRLRIDAHELWLDNDIVVTDRIPEVDRWLEKSDSGIISEGRHHLYGIYEDRIPKEINACAGFFGLPPGFDFHSKILELCEVLDGKPLGHYDEQGLTVMTVIGLEDFEIISMENMRIIEDWMVIDYDLNSISISEIPPGVHFVGVNRQSYHRGWKLYKKLTSSFML